MKKVDSIKNGDLMSFTHFVKVYNKRKDVLYGDVLEVYDIDNENDFTVRGTALVKQGNSANVYEKEERVTRTRLAELLSTAHNVPFTVKFVKADGKERTLIGRLLSSEPLMGRSYVEDLDIMETRLVDHRTIYELILKDTRYLLKK